jgi:ATP-dependent helicase HrpA
VRDEAAYAALLAVAREQHPASVPATIHEVLRVLEAWRACDKVLSGRAELTTLPALTDMKSQVERLMSRGFIGEAGAVRLREYPRYLKAVQHRRERLDEQVARDRQLMDQMAHLQDAWLNQMAALPEGRPPSAGQRAVRWLLEEYRVSLWAQHLGTSGSVSDQRIRKALAAVAAR